MAGFGSTILEGRGYIATPLELCDQRRHKGRCAKARAGLIKQVTGIDDPYEVPKHADLMLDTHGEPSDIATQRIFLKLKGLGADQVRAEGARRWYSRSVRLTYSVRSGSFSDDQELQE